MRIVFIRHGKTPGNLSKRYIGRTDEPLCAEGADELRLRIYPRCDAVICSPMKRCIQTAEIIYQGQETAIFPELRECDFGDFEGKNYLELSGSKDYQKWIDSGGKIAFPNGESPDEFRKRCISGFQRAVSEYREAQSAAFVVHGGTIMSIMDKYAVPHLGYYDWQIANGCGFVTEFDGEKITVLEKI